MINKMYFENKDGINQLGKLLFVREDELHLVLEKENGITKFSSNFSGKEFTIYSVDTYMFEVEGRYHEFKSPEELDDVLAELLDDGWEKVG